MFFGFRLLVMSFSEKNLLRLFHLYGKIVRLLLLVLMILIGFLIVGVLVFII